MAGILNNKERMIDFIITPQGRSQMADGRMRIEFATLTDLNAFYRSTLPGGIADDASDRLYFEAASLPCDMISPELEGGTVVQPFEAGQLHVDGMKIAEKTFTTASAFPFQGLNVLTGTQVFDKSEELMNTIGSHFQAHRILNTHDLFSNTSEFKVNVLTGSFIITKEDLAVNHGRGIYLKDITGGSELDGILELDNIASIYGDERFDHLPNFRYLPPVNVPDPGKKPTKLGMYPRLSQGLGSNRVITGEGNHLDADAISRTPLSNNDTQFGSLGGSSNSQNIKNLRTRQKVVISFEDISRDKNLVGQFFEFRDNGECEKLSAIDYGIVETQKTVEDPETGNESIETVYSHYYFLGKIVKDAAGADHWINIFTLKFCDEIESELEFPDRDQGAFSNVEYEPVDLSGNPRSIK